MKKNLAITLCVLVLFSLLLIINAVPANATSSSSYIFSEYYQGLYVTIDGKWTDSDEWHDVTTQYMPSSDSHLGLFEYKMDTVDANYGMTWLLEFADNTNDPGDKWQICVDGYDDGGSAPNDGDVMLEITGHTTLTTYVGSGSGWTESAWVETYWADSLTTSPHDPANHYVLEAQFSKAQWDWGVSPPPHGVRVAMYDESTDTWLSWPPTSTYTDPSSWGGIPDYYAAPAPEILSLGVMLVLSTAAVIVGLSYFRKPPKL